MKDQLYSKKSPDKIDEEYGAELTPRHFRDNSNLLSTRTNSGVVVGYIALFLALFSIAFYPIIFGSLAILLGLLAVKYGSRTLGLTATGFGAFSVVFNLIYPLFLR